MTKIVTLTLAMTMMVGATSITSEAKTSKKASALPAANAAITEFVETSLSFVNDYPEYVVVNGKTMHWTELRNLMKNKQVGQYVPSDGIFVEYQTLDPTLDGTTNCHASYFWDTDGFSYDLFDEPEDNFCVYNPFSGYGFGDKTDFTCIDVAKLQAQGAGIPLAFAQAHGFTNIQNIYDYLVSIGVAFTTNGTDGVARYNVNGKNIEINVGIDNGEVYAVSIALIGTKVNTPNNSNSGNEEQSVGYYAYDIYNNGNFDVIEGQGLAMYSNF